MKKTNTALWANPKIPQMFYLRKFTITVYTPKGERIQKTVHVFWNYRNTVNGMIDTDDRDVAKVAVLTGYLKIGRQKPVQIGRPNMEAEFYR